MLFYCHTLLKTKIFRILDPFLPLLSPQQFAVSLWKQFALKTLKTSKECELSKLNNKKKIVKIDFFNVIDFIRVKNRLFCPKKDQSIFSCCSGKFNLKLVPGAFLFVSFLFEFYQHFRLKNQLSNRILWPKIWTLKSTFLDKPSLQFCLLFIRLSSKSEFTASHFAKRSDRQTGVWSENFLQQQQKGADKNRQKAKVPMCAARMHLYIYRAKARFHGLFVVDGASARIRISTP